VAVNFKCFQCIPIHVLKLNAEPSFVNSPTQLTSGKAFELRLSSDHDLEKKQPGSPKYSKEASPLGELHEKGELKTTA
jgi:hypothetical protein